MATIIDLPKERLNKIKLADWLELNALLDSDLSSSIEDVSSQLKIAYGERRDEMERLRNDVSTELVVRQRKNKESYPFLYDGKLLVARNGASYPNHWTYLFCLLISYIGLETLSRKWNIWNWKTKEASSLFESISTIVAKNFLSSKEVMARALQFGVPRDSWKREHQPFRKALELLKSNISEGNIEANPTNSRKKDAGLDVIAWRAFPDNRTNKLFLLGQCAAGRDFKNKRWELKQFPMHYSLKVGVIHAFFVPHEISETDWFDFYETEIGIVFDRSRTAYYAQEWDGTNFKDRFQQILKKLRSYRGAL